VKAFVESPEFMQFFKAAQEEQPVFVSATGKRKREKLTNEMAQRQKYLKNLIKRQNVDQGNDTDESEQEDAR
jgi:ribosomal protein S18